MRSLMLTTSSVCSETSWPHLNRLKDHLEQHQSSPQLSGDLQALPNYRQHLPEISDLSNQRRIIKVQF